MIAFYNDTEEKVGEGCAFAEIRGLANKLAEHAARLAAVITMVADHDAGAISAEAMECGMALARHYAVEALRLFQYAAPKPELLLADKALKWLKTKGRSVFSLPDLYTFGPRPLRDKGIAANVVRVLADHRWIEAVPGGADLGGKRRQEVWRLVEG